MNKDTIAKITFTLAAFCCVTLIHSQNPYLPLWEFIPDSEPYVFEDPDKPGEYRVYIYGSHDSLIKEYCGREQVTWSAPVDDLTAWRYEGPIFESIYDRDGEWLNPGGQGDILYAPDVVERTDGNGNRKYYLYPNNQADGRKNMVAVADRPDGPFKTCNWSKEDPRKTTGILDFDPGVLIDDDGRAYAYWGFEKSWAGELDTSTMATLKPGTTAIGDLIPNKYQDGVFRFFEASSIRKIQDKYVFVYSRWTNDGEFGLSDTNYTLAYAYSDNPLGPFTYGGTIIDGRGRDTDVNGDTIFTAHPTGNTHGSIVEINGQWWVFYHRQTGTDEFSRQAMVAPIQVTVEKGKGGKVTISEGEYTSEGFETDGLDPFSRIQAATACYYTGPKPAYNDYPKFIFSGSYVRSTHNQIGPFRPMLVNNTDGSTAGYKYINFSRIGKGTDVEIILHLVPKGIDGRIRIMVGSPYPAKGGRLIGMVDISRDDTQELIEKRARVTIPETEGKQALFFLFESPIKGSSICDISDFYFTVR